MTSSDTYAIGDVRCTRVADFENFRMPATRMFASVSPEDLAAVEATFGPGFVDCASGEIIINFNAYVIDTGATIILVDPCIGDGKSRAQYALWHQRRSSFLTRLTERGYPPQSIDFVISTHLHADHVGWNTSWDGERWAPTFPNAQYLFVERELAYWRDLYASTGDPGVAYGSYVDSVQPILAAGVAKTILADTAIADGVYVRPAYGHTPGNVVIDIGAHSGAVLTGDLFHHPLQFLRPALSTNFCLNQAESRATRERLISAYAASGALLFPAHFVAPAAGRIVRRETAFGYEFVVGRSGPQ